ncbi:hypothetical protein HMI54_001469 [Coelomomyces lativittatus]|nr:hypothetical protein HMI54_001469 [Coelomomyces lativittatus]
MTWELKFALEPTTTITQVTEYPRYQEVLTEVCDFPQVFWSTYSSLPRHQTPFAKLEYDPKMIQTLAEVETPNKIKYTQEVFQYFLKYRVTTNHCPRDEIGLKQRLKIVAASLRSRLAELCIPDELYLKDLYIQENTFKKINLPLKHFNSHPNEDQSSVTSSILMNYVEDDDEETTTSDLSVELKCTCVQECPTPTTKFFSYLKTKETPIRKELFKRVAGTMSRKYS